MPFEPVVAVALDLRALGQRVAERGPRGGGEERLPAARERHDAGGERLGEALDLDRLGAAGHVVGSVLAQGDRADVQPGPGAEARARRAPGGRRARSGRRRRVVEQQEEAVGAVDLAPAIASEQLARPAIVLGPHLRGTRVAQALDQQRAVDHVGEEEAAFGYLQHAVINSGAAISTSQLRRAFSANHLEHIK